MKLKLHYQQTILFKYMLQICCGYLIAHHGSLKTLAKEIQNKSEIIISSVAVPILNSVPVNLI